MPEDLEKIEFKEYVRKPFYIKAVQITPENIHDLAHLVGTVQYKSNGQPYILVDNTKVPNMEKVFCDSWLTVLDLNVRCYTDRVFKYQFGLVTT